jgi:hypothetical protein
MGETPAEFYLNSAVTFLHFRLKQNRRGQSREKRTKGKAGKENWRLLALPLHGLGATQRGEVR